MLKEQLQQDLKAALLTGDTAKVTVLRSLKAAIMYAEIAKGTRGTVELSDQEILGVLAKEAKKRQESADSFAKGGAEDRAAMELQEKAIIDTYLPAALSSEEIEKLIDGAVASLGPVAPQTMGKIIAHVKQAAGAAADGATIAQLVKQRTQR